MSKNEWWFADWPSDKEITVTFNKEELSTLEFALGCYQVKLWDYSKDMRDRQNKIIKSIASKLPFEDIVKIADKILLNRESS